MLTGLANRKLISGKRRLIPIQFERDIARRETGVHPNALSWARIRASAIKR